MPGKTHDLFDLAENWGNGIPPDPCQNKHHGNTQSQDAYQLALAIIPEQRRVILELVQAAGLSGVTSREITGVTGIPLHVVCARLAELKRDKLVADSGRRREGCGVVVERCCYG